MLERLTLDQLRTFARVAEEGSFSAAARKLGRVQSAVSTAMANLEAELGVTLWLRSARRPELGPDGVALLAAARRVLGEVDALGSLAAKLADGLEASVSLCLDALFPVPALSELCAGFAVAYPTVDLRVDTKVLSAVSAQVLRGNATLGVVSAAGLLAGLEARSLARVRMVPVSSPEHALARLRAPIAAKHFSGAIQLVLSEHSDVGIPDQAVLSPRTWRIGDLYTKQALLRAGLGWGNLPEHLVRDDLRAGRLVRLQPAAWSKDEHTLRLLLVHRPSSALGPAQRWLVERIATLCKRG